jgi:hypothetical protein
MQPFIHCRLFDQGTNDVPSNVFCQLAPSFQNSARMVKPDVISHIAKSAAICQRQRNLRCSVRHFTISGASDYGLQPSANGIGENLGRKLEDETYL